MKTAQVAELRHRLHAVLAAVTVISRVMRVLDANERVIGRRLAILNLPLLLRTLRGLKLLLPNTLPRLKLLLLNAPLRLQLLLLDALLLRTLGLGLGPRKIVVVTPIPAIPARVVIVIAPFPYPGMPGGHVSVTLVRPLMPPLRRTRMIAVPK